MHVLIAFLTSLAALLYALERLGVDLGWLNPWAWRRRRRWQKMVMGNPVFSLTQPIDAIALLATAAAKIDGDISVEEKDGLKSLFEKTFKQTENETSELLRASVHLLGSGEEVYKQPEKILKASLEEFTDEQRSLSLSLIKEVIKLGSQVSPMQKEFYSKVEKVLINSNDKNKW